MRNPKVYSLILFFSLFLFSNLSFAAAPPASLPPAGIVVLQTDFGQKDGAVSAIKGVMYSVDKSLTVADLTHEVPAYNIWDASYWLSQVAAYWPKGTVFVSVVDPGVGTNRRSIVAESNNGYYFVTPDNGTLTAVANSFGLKQIRQIDEAKNRLPGSYDSYTFHGRDVYGYTAARLASGKISFAEVGPVLNQPIVTLSVEKAYIKDNKLYGTIVVLDPQYGNVWTDIDQKLSQQLDVKNGSAYSVQIFFGKEKRYDGVISFQKTFGEISKGKSLLYLNSLMNIAIGINQGNFSQKYNIGSGPKWHIVIAPAKQKI